jgi:hypothetical protein
MFVGNENRESHARSDQSDAGRWHCRQVRHWRAVGATLYLDPAATLDVDIFVMLPTAPGSSLLSLAPLYDYLKVRGGAVKDEHIVIGGWPVQFLLLSNELEREAVAESVSTAV